MALTVARIKGIEEPGDYTDSHGLTLRVSKNGTRSWVQRLTVDGKRRNIGLGSYPSVGIVEARNRAEENRKAVREGRDPNAEKRKARREREAKAQVPTLKQACQTVIELRRPTWSSDRHAKQWTESLALHAFPALGERRVDEISAADILALLTPIWTEKAETATRLQQRLATVFDWVIVVGYRPDNPVAAISKALPRRSRVKNHHPALLFTDVPAGLKKVKESTADPVTKLAFEFLVLTGSRTGEVRGATWGEIDLDARLWVIPASRMKARREHRVPMSDRAIEVLKEAQKYDRGNGLIFPAKRKGGQLSNMVFEMLLRRLEIPAVPHGFRASFRDWMEECSSASWAVAESALAHSSGERSSLGYLRSDFLEQRGPLMQSWADFLAKVEV